MGRRIALLFPGQGGQQVGMGRAVADRSPQARDTFDRIDQALGWPVSRLCFEGPADRLQETAAQQPAIFACSMALYAAWRAELPDGDQILCAAGHSLGEYGALIAAGAIGLEDGARLVLARGQAMQAAADRESGGMCAVLGLDRRVLEAICVEASDPSGSAPGSVVLANDNAPGQQVLSGGLAALERAIALAKARGARRIVPLKVGGAFHSPLMMPAVPELEAALRRLYDSEAPRALARAASGLPIPMTDEPGLDAGTEALRAGSRWATPLAGGSDTQTLAEVMGGLRPCTFPVVANSSCEWLREPRSIHSELLRQVVAPVRWVESVRAMAAQSPDLWVDVGPGKVVGNLLTRILPDAPLLFLDDAYAA